jgi:hypothetical protein
MTAQRPVRPKESDARKISGPSRQKIDPKITEYLAKRSSEKLAVVRDLVVDLEKEQNVSRDLVITELINLSSEKKIQVREHAPFQTLFAFAAAPSSLWYWGAVAAAFFSLAFIFATSGLALYARYAFGGLLVLFLPGYSLIELLYPKKNELDGLTRFALSIGLSLALVIIVGLILNYTPFGIRLLPIAVSLSFTVVILLTLALRRKYSYYKLVKDL